MKDLALLTSPDIRKAEVVTNHIVISEYVGLNRISVRKLIGNNKQDLEELGILSFERIKPIKDSTGGCPKKLINSIVTKLYYLLTVILSMSKKKMIINKSALPVKLTFHSIYRVETTFKSS